MHVGMFYCGLALLALMICLVRTFWWFALTPPEGVSERVLRVREAKRELYHPWNGWTIRSLWALSLVCFVLSYFLWSYPAS
jgi:hypothetical protein